LSAPVVAVLNLKGGVGKTTVSACIGRGLFDQKARGVLLVDLDPQFNLTQALESETTYKKFLEAGKTVLTAFEPLPSTNLFRIRTTAEAPPSAATLEHVLWHYTESPSKRLGLVMGNFDLIKYSLLSNHTQLNAAKGRFSQFVAASREKYDIVMLDCNPSSSFLTQSAIEVATDILVPVRPDKYSVLGLDLLSRFMDRLGLARIPKLHILLNAVSRNDLTDTEQLLRSSTYASVTLKTELYKSEILVARPNFHGFPVDRKVPYSAMLRQNIAQICVELARRFGI
jgi:chromosome partitioning protein